VEAAALPRRGTSRVFAFLGAEALPLTILAVYAVAVARLLPYELLQDSWLTLVGGREVAGGLPHADALTAWSQGAAWVDQQWLAQLAFYGLTTLGGIKLALLAHLSVLVGSMGFAMLAARRLGGSPTSVALSAAVVMLMAPWTLQLRSQTLAVPLFVALVWLLARDSRAPSRWVFLAFPLLALWANVHGTVVLAAGLVALRGLTLVRRAPARAVALVAVPLACVFASPYGLELTGYYRTMLLDPTLRTFVSEWRVTSPSAATALFYLGAFVTVWLLGRRARSLTLFERAVLVLTLAGGLLAIRSVVWFGLAFLILVPRLIEEELAARRGALVPPARFAPLGGIACIAIVFALGLVAAKPESWYVREWPSDDAARVATLANGGGVFADDRFADWLLWSEPELAGKVAYDVRFELLDAAELHRLLVYQNRIGANWRAAVSGYEIVVADGLDAKRVRALERNGYDVELRHDRFVLLRKNPA
jgi:hypothetical protein